MFNIQVCFCVFSSEYSRQRQCANKGICCFFFPNIRPLTIIVSTGVQRRSVYASDQARAKQTPSEEDQRFLTVYTN